MSDFAPISGGLNGVGSPLPLSTGSSSSKYQTPPSSNEVVRGEDSVQFSDSAVRASQEDQPPRMDKVNEVKAEIAAGTYENDQRLDGAIDALMKDLFA